MMWEINALGLPGFTDNGPAFNRSTFRGQVFIQSLRPSDIEKSVLQITKMCTFYWQWNVTTV